MAHEMIVTLSKGMQITIPASIREELGMEVGSRMEMEKKDENIVLKPIGDNLTTLFHKAKSIKPKHNLSIKEMENFNERAFR